MLIHDFLGMERGAVSNELRELLKLSVNSR